MPEESQPASQRLRRLEPAWIYRASLVSGVVYPLAYFLAPSGTQGPVWVWGLIAAYLLGIGLLGPHLRLVRDHLQPLYYARLWLIVGHFLVLSSLNEMAPFYAIGSVIGVFGAAAAIPSQRAFLAFTAFVAAICVGLFVADPYPTKLAFWGSYMLVLPFAYERLRRRNLLEREAEAHRTHLAVLVQERTRELTLRTAALSEANELLRREMAEREALEERLRTTQKLESLGELAGGVAHDFNNILMSIRVYAEMIEQQKDADEQVHRDAREVIRSADRARDLVGQLLTFSRRAVMQTEMLDLNEVLRDSESLLRPLIGKHIELRFELSPGRLALRANRNQLEQVIVNLAVNARDAMARGGRITVATASPTSAEPSEGAGHVLLSVADTGHGMEPSVLSRVFDPFFTTKDVGQGTGLGLSIVHGIVSQAGGHIRVQSRPGAGTRFDLYWPAAQDLPAEEVERERELPPQRASERVLLVEDSQELGVLVSRMLESDGYSVVHVRDAYEALEMLAVDSAVDLVLTDIVMPGMSGIELAHQLEHIRPDTRLLFMSGHLNHPSLQTGDLPERAVLLAKPFRQSQLREALHRVLA